MISLIHDIDIVQGDSSEEHAFILDGFPDLSDINWIAQYTVREGGLKGRIVQDSTYLGKDTTNAAFVFYLSPTVTSVLPVGKLFLIIEVRNLALQNPFRQEVVQCPLIIRTSGVVNV